MNKKHTREVKIPFDLPRMAALGIAEVRHSEKSVRRRIDYLSNCVEQNMVPDKKGKKLDGGWLSVPVPDGLNDHMADLASGIEFVRDCLRKGDLQAAIQRMEGIEMLVQSMLDQLDTERLKSKKGKVTADEREVVTELNRQLISQFVVPAERYRKIAARLDGRFPGYSRDGDQTPYKAERVSYIIDGPRGARRKKKRRTRACPRISQSNLSNN